MNNVKIHPSTSIADAAIVAYERGQHLQTDLGIVTLADGIDTVQYAKALRIKALNRVARAMRCA